MNEDLTRLEAERAQLVEMARLHERQARITTSILMFVAIGVATVVVVLLASAVLAGQLGVTGFVFSAVAAGLLFFILSRKLRSGTREVLVVDMLVGLRAQPSEDPIRAQIAEHDRRIAALKSGENL